MSEELDYYQKLATTMWKTRCARFGAAATLSFKDRFGVGTVSFLSIYMIGWSIASLAFPAFFSSTRGQIFSIVSIISSISLLAITLMEFAFGRSVRSRILHENALSISMLMRELEMELIAAQPNIDRMQKLACDYERLNQETQINHTTQDFKKWKYSTDVSGNFYISVLLWMRYQLYRFGVFYSSMFIYIILCALIVCVTIWCAFYFPL